MVSDSKVDIDKKFESIIRNFDIKHLYRESSAPYVYESITKIVSKKVEDWYDRWVITRKIFFDYLKNSKSFNKKKNNKEETLMLMMNYLDDDALRYLLSDINYNYSNGDGLILLDELAFNVKSPKIMNIIINEVDDKRLYFGNEKRNEYTDLCSMNVIAGNLDKALEVFNRDDFKLLITGEEYIENKDFLVNIVKNLVNLKEEKELKISFLDNILYSKKVDFFNVGIFDIIKNMCSEDKLNEYKYYFYNNKRVILTCFSEEKNNDVFSVKNKIKRK